MRVLLSISIIAGAAAHGAMNFPRPRNTNAEAVWSADASCLGEACYWYQVGCFNGCDNCTGVGKYLYAKPSDFPAGCTPTAPTNNKPETRSWNVDNLSDMGDFTAHSMCLHPFSAQLLRASAQVARVVRISTPTPALVRSSHAFTYACVCGYPQTHGAIRAWLRCATHAARRLATSIQPRMQRRPRGTPRGPRAPRSSLPARPPPCGRPVGSRRSAGRLLPSMVAGTSTACAPRAPFRMRSASR